MNQQPAQLTNLTEEEIMQYRDFVLSLISPPRDKYKDEVNKLHMAWGFIGEIIEFVNESKLLNNTEKCFKEAGDIMFYNIAFGALTGTAPDIVYKVSGLSIETLEHNVFKAVELFMDVIKKKEFYYDPDPNLHFQLQLAYRRLSHCATELISAYFPIRNIVDGNYAKLRARHKNGFSIESARAKVDEKST